MWCGVEGMDKIKKIRNDRQTICCGFFEVSEMRFELTQPYGHYPLKVACLPIPPPGHGVCQDFC